MTSQNKASGQGRASGAHDLGGGERRELKYRRLVGEMRRRILDTTWPPGARLPTLREIAAESGCSLTTVRHAFDELEEAGLIVRRQGSGTYVDEAPDRQLGRTVVGVLVPDTAAYFPPILQGIEEVLAENGARLVYASSQYDPAVEKEALAGLLAAGIDGLLYTPLIEPSDGDVAKHLARVAEIPVPVVLVERRLSGAGPADDTYHVCTDHEGGAYDAVRHLYAAGHRRIALAVRRSLGPAAAPIEVGFGRAVSDLHVTGMVDGAPREAWTPERADLAVQRIVREGCTGVLCFGDREAILLIAAARRAGLRIPEDLAVVSYDNEYADVAEIPLTAVSPRKYQLGRMSAEMLLQRLRSDDVDGPQQVRLRPTLVVRRSSTPAHREDATAPADDNQRTRP
ncbi:substrate-binding domain-containing protein [Luteimicrobium xylanilyticum]|uniref:Diguanylate cyclase n=1 Tax=Luteimicrobium xylanilyticum TaxID=1133546 RepID=A0A5P9QBF4_9MICO|nr:substrate-binding domain-containing protein [Luteimicrobium xylanilyticum]QFU98778.1 Diguanylate cyclase [Luteimicrobium xylanilyticum]